MEQYAAFFGGWHDYFGSYNWQKLGGGHRALGDTEAVFRRLEEMAKGREFEFSEGGL
ncbi:hypothetical protein ACIQPR_09085 [Streptomyces sp. NPDC091280]|uniref:hypothetical protein n=1 Tax=Streptomyces sp. NPDC091280 TaxID=3365984 RepID=UPI0038159A0E